MTLPIQVKTNPYMEDGSEGTEQDEIDEEVPPPSQEEIFKAIETVRESIHTAAAINIGKAQARQAKNYDLKHQGNLLGVGDKVMWFNSKEAARKGNKLAPRWLGPYTIVAVHKNGNYSVADDQEHDNCEHLCNYYIILKKSKSF